jgi:DNA-directed RNA polymerase specialized sigma24 family protein
MSPLALDVLERDWQRELSSPSLRSRFRAWREAEPALARFADPATLVRFLRGPAASAEKDAVLCGLLARARSESLAGRVVLEAMRPGLLRLAGRILVDAREREEMWSLLLAVAWEEIRDYPLERRPRRVAANLLLDTLHRTVGELRRARAAQSGLGIDPTDGRAAASPQPDEGDVDALIDRAMRACAITQDEADIVLGSRIDGVALAALAESAGVSYNTMKLRRQRAERRLLLFLGYPSVPRGQQRRPSSVLGSPALGLRALSDGMTSRVSRRR